MSGTFFLIHESPQYSAAIVDGFQEVLEHFQMFEMPLPVLTPNGLIQDPGSLAILGQQLPDIAPLDKAARRLHEAAIETFCELAYPTENPWEIETVLEARNSAEVIGIAWAEGDDINAAEPLRFCDEWSDHHGAIPLECEKITTSVERWIAEDINCWRDQRHHQDLERYAWELDHWEQYGGERPAGPPEPVEDLCFYDVAHSSDVDPGPYDGLGKALEAFHRAVKGWLDGEEESGESPSPQQVADLEEALFLDPAAGFCAAMTHNENMRVK